MFLAIYVISIILHGVLSDYVFEDGSTCILKSGLNGTCTAIKNCPNVDIQAKPQICRFEGPNPIICCDSTHKIYKSVEQCNILYTDLPPRGIVGGVGANPKEFPHMALLGYQDGDAIQWGCGGTLINKNYVLTAGHCLFSLSSGAVKFVRLGDLDISKNSDDAQPQNFTVLRAIKHPDYKPPNKYNDIALLQLDKAADFTKYVKPACLKTTFEIEPHVSLIATGWGNLEFAGARAELLQKVYLSEVDVESCKEYFPADRKLKNGIVGETQMCAAQPGKDTCQGDSGGPLQIHNAYRSGYTIVGVTSFGKACGIATTPGVYTRVSAYIDWIESVAWN